MRPDDAMRRALELARRGIGLTRPNPPVGAVLVKASRVVGEGWHRAAGRPHAEIEAIRHAGPRARGADLFVTLEPCSTHGRTPPCTEAIARAGIRRVWAAVRDPNPRHRGRGLRQLAGQGIEVHEGLCADEARAILAPFAHRILNGRPRVALKMACTLDGRIADADGNSRWISGPASRARVQELRRASDAILIGSRTACADNPRLTPRPARGRAPWRVLVDSTGRTPPAAAVFTADAGRTIVAVTHRCPIRRRSAFEATGARCWVFAPDASGRVPLEPLLRRLSDECHVMQLLCEGGGALAGSLLREGRVDELHWIIAPRWLGDGATPAVSGAQASISDTRPFRVLSAERMGTDVWMVMVPRAGNRRSPKT
ncbi:MAG: bifunctional diaminohydroxyphosphoribosylaminopyrimidine deaminase/5-amino-6-(5-phosphoribosylamino)uracil reductase RibD [Kiritimatiellae bacterium]|nr:bifunctional diaminohydroxyphosphoribosylaminopyrimidine deaminase/5-amino-6-(5-phosphoribosylamino)uracil reductase RibD [Kiritimatiellia bacterium]